MLLICSNSDLPSPLPASLPGMDGSPVVYLQICSSPDNSTASPEERTEKSNHLKVMAAEGKRGQYQFLQTVLPLSMTFISRHLRLGFRICISCDTGKDMSIGVALAALQSFFEEDGSLIQGDTIMTSRKCGQAW